MGHRTAWLLALASIGPLGACGAEDPKENQVAVPEFVLMDLSFRVHRGERLAAWGTADRLAYRRDTGDFRAERIAVRLEGDAAGEVTVSGQTAAGNPRSRDLQLGGGIRIAQGRATADSEGARYLPAEGLVRGEGPVTVRAPGSTLSGPRWTLDPRAARLEVLGGTRTVLEGAP